MSDTAVTTPQLVTTPGKSYGEVLKSSALIGASSIANIALGIVRTKAMAVLLGPSGVGLLGLYNSIIDLTRGVAGLGVSSSGVRQIAESAGTGDPQRISHTVVALRRVALCSGVVAALLLMIFSKAVARVTFGDTHHAFDVALLAAAVFFANISSAQTALIQGLRRIADLSKINVLGGAFGTAVSIPIVYLFGERGLVPALICVAGMAVVTSWWYARKVSIDRLKFGLRDIIDEVGELLKLGVVFMASGLMVLGVAYLVRTFILRKLGVEAAGYYQAAWALGGLYVGFILQAMSADFFPRLTAVATRNDECNRLVNEQTEVGLLLASPGILGTLVFAPLVIQLFYSGEFGPAVELLRWFCLGMMLRVVSWPMGFILVAKGERRLFFWSELFGGVVQIALVWVLVPIIGLKGAGIGFAGMYVAYWIGIYFIVRRLSGFRWSSTNRRLGSIIGPAMLLVFVSSYFLGPMPCLVVGTSLTLMISAFCLKSLCALLPLHRFPQPLRKVLALLRFVP